MHFLVDASKALKFCLLLQKLICQNITNNRNCLDITRQFFKKFLPQKKYEDESRMIFKISVVLGRYIK